MRDHGVNPALHGGCLGVPTYSPGVTCVEHSVWEAVVQVADDGVVARDPQRLGEVRSSLALIVDAPIHGYVSHALWVVPYERVVCYRSIYQRTNRDRAVRPCLRDRGP